jgi:hypothetical protein
MQYLTLAQFYSPSVIPAGVDTVFVENQIKLWSSQLNRLTHTQFVKPLVKKSKSYNTYCSLTKMKIGAWLNDSDFSVDIREKGTNIWKPLVKEVDYQISFPEMATYINGQEILDPIVGLDFSCLTCFCCCEEIRVTGYNCWSDGLPDDLLMLFRELTKLQLATGSTLSTSTADCTSDNQTIESMSDPNESVKFYINTDQVKTNANKLNKGLLFGDYQSILWYYARYSIGKARTMNI